MSYAMKTKIKFWSPAFVYLGVHTKMLSNQKANIFRFSFLFILKYINIVPGNKKKILHPRHLQCSNKHQLNLCQPDAGDKIMQTDLQFLI